MTRAFTFAEPSSCKSTCQILPLCGGCYTYLPNNIMISGKCDSSKTSFYSMNSCERKSFN